MCFINSELQTGQKLKGGVGNQLSTCVVEARYATQESFLSFVSFAKEKQISLPTTLSPFFLFWVLPRILNDVAIFLGEIRSPFLSYTHSFNVAGIWKECCSYKP